MGDPPPVVSISRDDLTLEEVLRVADGSSVELTSEVVEVIERSRHIVDEAIARGDAIYGVTTGVGHARDQRLPPDALTAMQPFLVEMHLGAIGDPLPTRVVRAAMAARLNGFARGGSGVSLGVARSLEGMLNHGIHPVIPRSGSVGAGDLGQLAILGRAMLGRGDVEWQGSRVPAAEALDATGMAPVDLEPKDALAIISSNALSVGLGICLAHDVARLLEMADRVAAASMEAIRANPSFFDPVVAGARSSPGQEATSQNLRDQLAGSSRTDPAVASVQDPLSFRVVPQVHGACRDVMSVFEVELAKELNAASDNPLVDLESRRVLSNGNFHAMNLALSAESVKLALAHVGTLSERRCGQIWDSVVSMMGEVVGGDSSQPRPTVEGVPPFMAGLALRYPIAARYTRLRQLAQPVTLDVPVLDLSVEDHASNAAEVLATAQESTRLVIEILAVEVLLAHARLFTSPGEGSLGSGTGDLVDRLATLLTGLPPETMPDQTHAKVIDLLISEMALIGD